MFVTVKIGSRGRIVFLTFAVLFCGICMIYYATCRVHSPFYTGRGLTLPSDMFKNEKPDTTVSTKTTNIKETTPLKPTVIYDLHTYGLKLFECSSNSPMASPVYSKMTFPQYDHIENVYFVRVDLYDENQVGRNCGGDVIVMWAEQSDGDGRVSGHVTDNLNGSYTGKFRIFWTGKSVFKVKIASTIENQCLRSNALFRYGNTVYAKQKGWGIYAVFEQGEHRYRTKCGSNPYIYHNNKLCNFTTLNAHIPWYCGALPENYRIPCLTIGHFTIGEFDTSEIPSDEKMTNFGHGAVEDTVEIDVTHQSENDRSVKCSEYPTRRSWTSTLPSGYWINGRWSFIHCDNSAMQFSYSAYRTCLNGKYFAVIGDSTARQISEFVLKHVLDFDEVNLNDGLGTGPKRSYQVHEEYKGFNITTTYSKHEFPFHNIDFPPYNITSMPLEIQRLESAPVAGKDLIVLLHYNQHLHAYPIEEFHLRIRLLIPAIKSLLKAKPGAKVFFKGPHMTIDDIRWFDPRISLIYMDILYKEFHPLRDHVTYLDTWSITVAHNSEVQHPAGYALDSHIHQLMSYICNY